MTSGWNTLVCFYFLIFLRKQFPHFPTLRFRHVLRIKKTQPLHETGTHFEKTGFFKATEEKNRRREKRRKSQIFASRYQFAAISQSSPPPSPLTLQHMFSPNKHESAHTCSKFEFRIKSSFLPDFFIRDRGRAMMMRGDDAFQFKSRFFCYRQEGEKDTIILLCSTSNKPPTNPRIVAARKAKTKAQEGRAKKKPL